MSMRRRGRQELEGAYERGMPEAYLPWDVVKGLDGAPMRDDRSLLNLGYRASPLAIRTLTQTACNGFFDRNGYHPPISFQARVVEAAYAYFNDFISKDELELILQGKALRTNLAQDVKDIHIQQSDWRLGSRLFGTLEEVVFDLERRRRMGQDFKVVLFHGKWNFFPHPGHLMVFTDIVQVLEQDYKERAENIIFVVMCDTNKAIEESGSFPFLNTYWRTSLMSYIPYVDYVCPTGDFEYKCGDQYWLHKYKILRPDYVNVDPDHKRVDFVVKRCLEVGSKVIMMKRFPDWLPTPGNPFAYKIPNGMSVTNIRRNKVDNYVMERALKWLMMKKVVRDDMYGPRRWFSSVIQPDSARGLTVEGIAPKILVPSIKYGEPVTILKPPQILDPREAILMSALGMLGVF